MGWEAGGWWEPGVPSVRWGPPTRGKVSAPQKCPSRQFLDDCNLPLMLEMHFCCGLPFLGDK